MCQCFLSALVQARVLRALGRIARRATHRNNYPRRTTLDVSLSAKESNAGRRVPKEQRARLGVYEEHTLHAAAATENSQDPSGQTARSQSLGEGTSWSTSMYRSATALAPFSGKRHKVVVFHLTGS